ncbi:MAG TPA: hypothetical protein VNO74_00570 [Methylomirabilota bacterium]|nr:hypothetical protein [Methylomirabilota bacterium]
MPRRPEIAAAPRVAQRAFFLISRTVAGLIQAQIPSRELVFAKPATTICGDIGAAPSY